MSGVNEEGYTMEPSGEEWDALLASIAKLTAACRDRNKRLATLEKRVEHDHKVIHALSDRIHDIYLADSKDG
jgi:hypothetical protein